MKRKTTEALPSRPSHAKILAELEYNHLTGLREEINRRLLELEIAFGLAPASGISARLVPVDKAESKPAVKTRRVMNPAARARIAAAQRQRWAAHHAAQAKARSQVKVSKPHVSRPAPKKAQAVKTAAAPASLPSLAEITA